MLKFLQILAQSGTIQNSLHSGYLEVGVPHIQNRAEQCVVGRTVHSPVTTRSITL